MLQLFMNQILFAKLRIQHPNLERIYGFCEHASNPALVLEYMPSGKLNLKRLRRSPLHEKLRLVCCPRPLYRISRDKGQHVAYIWRMHMLICSGPIHWNEHVLI